MSLATLLGLSTALHLYVGARLVADLPTAWAGVALALLLLVSALFAPMGMLARRYARPPLSDTLAAIGLVFMGLFSSLLVLAVLRDVLLLVLWLASLAFPLAPTGDAVRSASAAAA